MARYGMDYNNTNRGNWNRTNVDRGFDRNSDVQFGRGSMGRENWTDRESWSGMGGSDRGFRGAERGYGTDRGFNYDVTGRNAGGRGSMIGNRGGYDVGYRAGGYDRDFGDRVREGWQDIKQSARGMFNRGYDRDW